MARWVMPLPRWTHCFTQVLTRMHASCNWLRQSVHLSELFSSPLFLGSASGKSIPLKPIPLPPPQSSSYSMPPPSSGHGNHTPANTNHMLDYLESQVRGMDMASPLLQVCYKQSCIWHCIVFSPESQLNTGMISEAKMSVLCVQKTNEWNILYY